MDLTYHIKNLTKSKKDSFKYLFDKYERDIVQYIKTLPGVQSGVEGEGNLYIRGGNSEQNLILLEGVPIYHSANVFGFVPYFNSNIINHFKIFKEGFPAKYSGRISSVIDIKLKEGSKQKFHGNLNLGALMAQATFEGPVIKDKMSFLISGRSTYLGLFADKYLKAFPDDSNYGYQVYDVNTKINYAISETDDLSITCFLNNESADYNIPYEFYELDKQMKYDILYRNSFLSVKWNRQISNRLKGSLLLYYNSSDNNIQSNDLIIDEDIILQNLEDEFISSMMDFAIKLNFSYRLNDKHKFLFGLHNSIQRNNPSTMHYSEINNYSHNVSNNSVSIKNEYKLWDLSAYFDDTFNIGKGFSSNLGLNYSLVKTGNTYYSFIEPRSSLNIDLFAGFEANVSYSFMHQSLHFLNNYMHNLPIDFWIPSTEKIRPITSHQFSLGLSKTFLPKIELSIEGYYKSMNNMISVDEENRTGFLSENFEENTIEGEGRSYGIEFLAKKNIGKLEGWIAYTLSWSERKFDGVNSDDWFPYKYDRRHDINCAIMKSFGKNIDASITWVYGTGTALTVPIARFVNEYGYESIIYSKKNSFRMEPYHRMDFSISYTRHKNKSTSKWNFSIYNLYNRKNPLFIYYQDEQNKFKQYSLFPIMPSISYNYVF